MTYETSRFRQKITSPHSLLHEMSLDSIDPKAIGSRKDSQFRLLGFDHQKLLNGVSFRYDKKSLIPMYTEFGLEGQSL